MGQRTNLRPAKSAHLPNETASITDSGQACKNVLSLMRGRRMKKGSDRNRKRETQWLAVIDSGAGQPPCKGPWDDKANT
jgi:hypothetical protein